MLGEGEGWSRDLAACIDISGANSLSAMEPRSSLTKMSHRISGAEAISLPGITAQGPVTVTLFSPAKRAVHSSTAIGLQSMAHTSVSGLASSAKIEKLC